MVPGRASSNNFAEGERDMKCKLVKMCLVVLLSVCVANVAQVSAAGNSKPIVDSFNVSGSSLSPIPITAFTAHDPDGSVAGYLCTDSSATPSPSDPGWGPTPPTSCATAKTGSITLYGWAKDDVGAISTAKTATSWAVGGHTHSISDIVGLQSALDAANNRYANVVVVAKSGGDFTDPIAAIESIVDASSTNPYLVKIMPGVYDFGSNALYMKEYVDIEGAGENATVLTSAVERYVGTGTVYGYGTGKAELRFLTISNQSAGGTAIVISYASTRVTHVSAAASGSVIVMSGIGEPKLEHVTVNSSGVDGIWDGIWVQGGSSYPGPSVVISDTTVTSSGFGIRFTGGCTTAPIIRNTTINASTAIYLSSLEIILTNVSATGAVTGISNNNGSSTTITNSSISGGLFGYLNRYGGVTTIDHSVIAGGTRAIDHDANDLLKVGSSKLVGGIFPSGTGTLTCVNSHDGNYLPLNSFCE